MLHKFEFDGKKMVLDVHSGSVHEVDELVWWLLDDFEVLARPELLEKFGARYGAEEVAIAIAEIEELEREGLLFSPDPYKGKYSPPAGGITKALCLHLAHSCNLRCRYCFAGQGSFGGANELMPAGIGKSAIDFLIGRSGSRKNLNMDFFGGEPLLNFQVLKELVAYGRLRGREEGKEIEFTVTTNALLLNSEISSYLNQEGISAVLSLDGRREVHDNMRQTPGGGGSYEQVLERIRSFVDSRDGSNYIIRGTYTRCNLDFCADVLHMADLGYKHLSVEPVVATSEAAYAICEEDLPVLFSQYEQLARELLRRREEGRPVDFFHFNIDLDGGPCLPKRLTGCGAGYEYLAVAPNGDLYPCHQFVGRPKFLLGNVSEGLVNGDIGDVFRNTHVYTKEDCAACWAKFYCSGGCHANAELLNGSIYKPYLLGCALMKKRIECALYLKVKESSQAG
ncbi:MAG: thioether cross-link-forming SCIFF peptide maturase [Desulfotomaculaceae bacterium]|nr:thioether cross-link-forming SCIFF peptide maturase [Desulfotomaculaceae bacterium]